MVGDDDEDGDAHAPLPYGDLDHLAQALYGVVVALNAHLRRSHRPGSRAAQEVTWAIEQVTLVQRRLMQGRHPS